MAGPATGCSGGGGGLSDDGRLDAPAFHRNHGVIVDELVRLLGQEGGDGLEIGSGTGQHAVAFAEALPRVSWWPTDLDPAQLASIDAWRRHAGLANLNAPTRLDAAEDPWRPDPPVVPLERGLAAVVAVNVIHIAPWRVALGLLAGAGRYLRPGGPLLLYGPFKRDGAHTAPSNAAFDRELRARNPEWGVRDTADVAGSAEERGLQLEAVVPVPANNHIVVFRKAP